MSFIAAALIGGGAALVGGYMASKSAGKAADAQGQATRDASATALDGQRESIAFQQKQADQARADNEPWRNAGAAALNKLAVAPDFNASNMLGEPGYQFGLTEGMKGVTNSAAARGGLLSGAALKVASRYNTDYASTKYGEAFGRDAVNKNRLASIAGVGQVAAGQNAGAANALGQSVGNTLTGTASAIGANQVGAGNARASGYLAQGNALTGALNAGASAWNGRNALSSPIKGITEGATNQTANFDYYGPGYSP